MALRHEWYQTDYKIVLTIFLKNIVENNYSVTIAYDSISFTATDKKLLLNLYKPIIVAESSQKQSPNKVEITLLKQTFEMWEQLEKKLDAGSQKPMKGVRNWDKLAKEIEANDLEEAVVSEQLERTLQQIYNDNSDDVKRAMNKSYKESNGTAIIADWSEAKKDKPNYDPDNKPWCKGRK